MQKGLPHTAQKIYEEFVKKCLTNRATNGIIYKLSSGAAKNMPSSKKFEKT